MLFRSISSPPSSVTNQAVPKHPSAAYPDLKEPTFFAPRDARLDETVTRQQIEDALSSIVDRSAHTTRDEMMEKFGLKPPKRFTPDYQPALDTTRLEASREKYELLKEVAESYARINSRRTNSIVMQSWTISDRTKFASFIHLTQQKIDFLVNSMGVDERIDRAMRMDIRNFGWHITADRARIAQDISKLKLISDACKDDYPQYIIAVTQALDNISRESRENSGVGGSFSYNPYAAPTRQMPEPKRTASNSNGAAGTNGASNGKSKTKPPKRPGMFSRFLSFRNKSKEEVPKSKAHQQKAHQQQEHSQSATIEPTADPDRSLSDAGPQTGPAPPTDSLERVRSRSLDAGAAPAFNSSSAAATSFTAPAVSNLDEQVLQNKLERLDTKDTVHLPLEHTETVQSMISRHDQAYRVR